jgi:hypothetical protein
MGMSRAGVEVAGEATESGQENGRYQAAYQTDQEQRVHLMLDVGGQLCRIAARRRGGARVRATIILHLYGLVVENRRYNLGKDCIKLV